MRLPCGEGGNLQKYDAGAGLVTGDVRLASLVKGDARGRASSRAVPGGGGGEVAPRGPRSVGSDGCVLQGEGT